MIETAASLLDENKFEEYEALLSNVEHGVNLHPIWFTAYLEVFKLYGKELILEARDSEGGKLLGFLPLFRRDDQPTRIFKHRRLLPLGYQPTDFFDIVSLTGKNAEVAQSLAKWFRVNRGTWDQLKINLIPSESPNWESFTEQLKREGFNPVVSHDQAYFKLDTTVPYSEYLQTMETGKQKEMRYYRNKLSKAGTFLFEHIGSGCTVYFEECASIYMDRRNTQNQSNPFTRSYMPLHKFMKNIVEEYARRGWVRLCILKLNDTPIAYAYHFIYNRVDYYSVPAFLEEYKTYSPGKVLLMELIRNAFEDPGIDEFNFMRLEAPYKAWFNPVRKTYTSITVDNPWSWRNKTLPVMKFLSNLKCYGVSHLTIPKNHKKDEAR